MPLGELHGIGPGTKVLRTGAPFRVPVGPGLLGRVIDGLGDPLDGRERAPRGAGAALDDRRPARRARAARASASASGSACARSTASCPAAAGSGSASSPARASASPRCSGMIARSTSASVNVIALVGERGREVREFIERDLGDALEHSVVVVATSDQPALVRIKAAFTATTIAEYFRDQGHDVMLMMDSVTRFAMAQREIGLAIGEPPATRGYTPSVFALLPRLLERAGTSPTGSITGLYTVLVDGDDMNEPIADAVRSILDGHVVLTRSLAHAGHYPAIDVLQSVSRLVGEIVIAGGRARRPAPARARSPPLHEKQDLISIGAYNSGADPAARRRARASPAHRRLPAPVGRSSPATQRAPTPSCSSSPPPWSSSVAQRSGEILDAEEITAEEHPAVQPEPGPSAIPALGLSL